MKLNPNCIRDILIAVEDTVDFDHFYVYCHDQPSELNKKYTHSEIIYHIKQAADSNLITISPFFDGGDLVYITDLTPYGHEFLANIRTETVWNRLLKKGVASLPILFQLAKEFALAYYQKS